MKKKLLCIFLILFVCAFALAGCGKKGIEGTWVLYEEIEASGNKLSKSELMNMGISETFVIEGGEVKYNGEVPLAPKPVEMSLILEDLGNNRYNFCIPGGYIFVTATVKGNTMTYEVGDQNNPTKMIFKRK